jgi:hypothetical protein
MLALPFDLNAGGIPATPAPGRFLPVAKDGNRPDIVGGARQ